MSAKHKSGGKPTFLTLRLLDLLDGLHLERRSYFKLNAIHAWITPDSNQLRVRKVGLPPLRLRLDRPIVFWLNAEVLPF